MNLSKALATTGFLLFAVYYRWLAWKWVAYLVALAERSDMNDRLRIYQQRRPWVVAAVALPLWALTAGVIVSRTLPGGVVVLASVLALAPGLRHLLNEWPRTLRPLGYGGSARKEPWYAGQSEAKSPDDGSAYSGVPDMPLEGLELQRARRRLLPIFWGGFGVALSLNVAILFCVLRQERSLVLLLAGAAASAAVAILFLAVIILAERRLLMSVRKRQAAGEPAA